MVIDEQIALVTPGWAGGKWQVGAVTDPTADGRGFVFSTAATLRNILLLLLLPPAPPSPSCLCRNNRMMMTKKTMWNLVWLEMRKRKKWRRKKSSGSCSTPLIMTSRRTRQANKLLSEVCSSFLYVTFALVKKKKQVQGHGEGFGAVSWTVNHILHTSPAHCRNPASSWSPLHGQRWHVRPLRQGLRPPRQKEEVWHKGSQENTQSRLQWDLYLQGKTERLVVTLLLITYWNSMYMEPFNR